MTVVVPDHIRAAAARVPTRLDRQLVEQALALYDAGWSPTEIALRLPVSRSTVHHWRRGSGLRPNGVRSADKRLPDDQVARTIELYQQGLPMREVGRRLGVTESAVWGRLKRAGVFRRPTGAPSERARPKMPVGLVSVREAAEMAGLAPVTLRRRIAAGEVVGAVRVKNDRQGPDMIWGIPRAIAEELRRVRLPRPAMSTPPRHAEAAGRQLSSGRQDRWLPAAPLAAWVKAQPLDERTLAELSGVPARRLYGIRVGEQQHITLTLADRLLTAHGAHLTDVWPDLDQILGLENAA